MYKVKHTFFTGSGKWFGMSLQQDYEDGWPVLTFAYWYGMVQIYHPYGDTSPRKA